MTVLFVLMPVAAVALFLHAAASALVGFVASRLAAQRTSWLWAGLILAPTLLAIIAAAALLSPHPFGLCHCTAHALHHPHLCLAHPDLAASLALPSLAFVGAWLVWVTPRLAKLVVALVASARWVRNVRRAPAVPHARARLVDCGARTAFTAGALRPIIVLDRTLWTGLDEEARAAVLEHESAHVERADGLTLVALRVCLALSPLLPARLLDRWRRAAELACDRRAAQRLGAVPVAQALLAVHALGSSCPEEAIAVGVLADGGLEDRVHALLDAEELLGPSSDGSDLVAVIVPAIGACLLAMAWPGDLLHHAVETLLGSFGH